MQSLTDQQRAVLDFETAHPVWKYPGAREAAIRADLGISDTRYAQILNHLLDHPAAVAHAPATVHRLQRLRDARRAQRASDRPA